MAKEFYKKTWFWVVLVVVILALWIGGTYNNFISLDTNVETQWSEVGNQYQRQADLIENIVSTVSSQVGTETKFVKEVIDARNSAQAYASASSAQKDTAGQQMNSGVQTFINAVAESYPQLLASEGYTALRDELSGTQNRITTARGRYIDAIKSYNIAVKRFPSNILAGMFGFSQREYYTSQSGTNTPVLGNGTLP
ncbi:LemA family protein [Candidatus Pacearchaeota archaeon]|nr:LemA family protein [Candidatus Pacearchaeota archaeon]